jgi:hypothetical protein
LLCSACALGEGSAAYMLLEIIDVLFVMIELIRGLDWVVEVDSESR